MSKFDERRNLHESVNEDQMAEVIRAQEEAINQLKAQLQHQQQNVEQGFWLEPRDVLTQCRQLRGLDADHDVNAFISSVEAIMAFCPLNNKQLENLAISIVVNEKINGAVGSYIRELGTSATWDQIKSKLREYHRPRTTYGDIFNKCREIKVSNLRELFIYFEKAKYDINQIYLFDDNRPSIYRPDEVDRDLVNILIEKIDIPMRTHLDQNSTLNTIITRYSQIKALDDPRAIHIKYRKNTNTYNKNLSIHNNNYKTSTPNINKNTQYNTYTQRPSNFNTSSQTNPPNLTSSNPSRISRMSVDTRNSKLQSEPMEIGTLHETQTNVEKEINFLISPQNLHYQ